MYSTKKIYYDILSGEVIWSVDYTRPKTIDFEADYNSIKLLNDRVKTSIALLILNNGQYAQDFAECTSYRVNPETRELEFSYEPIDEGQEPTYRTPLSEEIDGLKQQVANTDELVMSLLEMMYLQ